MNLDTDRARRLEERWHWQSLAVVGQYPMDPRHLRRNMDSPLECKHEHRCEEEKEDSNI